MSHPFTAIVRKCGGIDKEYAEVEFLWKLGRISGGLGQPFLQGLVKRLSNSKEGLPWQDLDAGPVQQDCEAESHCTSDLLHVWAIRWWFGFS